MTLISTQLALANQENTALNELLKAENLRMSAELEITKQLQQMILPKQKELESIDRNCLLSAAGIRQAVIDDVRQHIGSQEIFNDINLVVIKQK